MRKRKEYPATHSMSTAWFGVDEDGNVAILSFDENGPVPSYIPESCAYEVVFDRMVIDDSTFCMKIFNYTDEQVDEMMSKSKLVEELVYPLECHLMIQIDVVKEGVLFNLLERVKCAEYWTEDWGCLSRKKGIYIINMLDIDDDIFMQLVKDKVILKCYEYELHFNSEYNNEEVKFEHTVDNFPFYVYQQPYWTAIPMKRTIVPHFPVKIEQMSFDNQQKALRLPLKFADYSNLQIAEYFSFQCNDDKLKIEGSIYVELPLTNGGDAYMCSSSVPRLQCGKDCKRCVSAEFQYFSSLLSEQIALYPTVLIVKGICDLDLELYSKRSIAFQCSVIVPYIQGVGSNDRYLSSDELEEGAIFVDKERWFANCRINFERIVTFFRPRVLLLHTDAEKVLSGFYAINGQEIHICNEVYPCFLLEQLSVYQDTIDALALQSYRGTKVRHIIDKNENCVVEQIDYDE